MFSQGPKEGPRAPTGDGEVRQLAEALAGGLRLGDFLHLQHATAQGGRAGGPGAVVVQQDAAVVRRQEQPLPICGLWV